MKEKYETVYVKADMNSVCYEPQIKIMDVMSVQCSDPAIAAGVKNKTLYTFKKDVGKKKKRIEVFSILNVIDLILQDYPNVEDRILLWNISHLRSHRNGESISK